MAEERRIKGNLAYFFIKRVFDIVASSVAIVLLSWLLVILSVLVKVSSPGPVFFKDKRIGKDRKKIVVFKFRTMYTDAEDNLEKYLTKEQIAVWLKERKLDDDPRITPIGRFLRKTSLDELPQLFNIFAGSMSVVGTRPITERELTMNFTEEERQVLCSGRPGLTGYWQVYGRSNVTYETGERQRLELEYYYRRSFLFDTKLIFLTIPVVLKKEGAK